MLERLTRLQCLLLGGVAVIVGGGLAVAAIVVMVVAFGWYDTAADAPHWPIVPWALHTTMIDSVWLRSPTVPSAEQFSSEQVRAGFAEYDEHCTMCHGAPGISRSRWVVGLDPTPPYLIDVSRHFSPSEIKTIIAHGIKMTAMPAWGLTLSGEKVRDLVAFLERLPDITPVQYRKMRAERHGSDTNARPDLASLR